MSGAESELPETLTGCAFACEMTSDPDSRAVAGVMPSLVGGAGPSIAAGVGPIALLESSAALAYAMFVPSDDGTAPNGDCANAPPHPVASRAVSDALRIKRALVFMIGHYAIRRPLETRKNKPISHRSTDKDPAFFAQ